MNYTPDGILSLLEKTLLSAYRVRLAQKRYFKTRDRVDLVRAKTAEADLDRALKELGYDLEN